MVYALCEEFEWTPTDEEIKAFVIEMIEPPDRAAFAFMIKKYRDDKEAFLKEFEDYKKGLGSNTQT